MLRTRLPLDVIDGLDQAALHTLLKVLAERDEAETAAVAAAGLVQGQGDVLVGRRRGGPPGGVA